MATRENPTPKAGEPGADARRTPGDLCAFAGAGPVLARLNALAAHPPQSLVMEGGSEADRDLAALAWAAILNCRGAERPCRACPPCRQIAQGAFVDLKVFGLEEKIAVDDVREALPEWGQPPRGDGMRVSVFRAAHEMNPAVANLLLKTLEEPRPGNAFVLLAPQRERLLQTLVSRSFVLTLPWPAPAAPDPDTAEWLEALLRFLDTGQGWFERTGTKGAADRALCYRLLAACQRELALALSGDTGASPAARRLARLGPAGLRRFDLVLEKAQEALSQPTVMPALVLDWLATAMIAKGRG